MKVNGISKNFNEFVQSRFKREGILGLYNIPVKPDSSFLEDLQLSEDMKELVNTCTTVLIPLFRKEGLVFYLIGTALSIKWELPSPMPIKHPITKELQHRIVSYILIEAWILDEPVIINDNMLDLHNTCYDMYNVFMNNMMHDTSHIVREIVNNPFFRRAIADKLRAEGSDANIDDVCNRLIKKLCTHYWDYQNGEIIDIDTKRDWSLTEYFDSIDRSIFRCSDSGNRDKLPDAEDLNLEILREPKKEEE